MSDVIDIRQFLRHGLLPEAGPLQPREVKAAPRPRELTEDEKVALVLEMATHHKFWREAVMEAIPESDTYCWFLTLILSRKADPEAMRWARKTIVDYVERVLAKRDEDWSKYL